MKMNKNKLTVSVLALSAAALFLISLAVLVSCGGGGGGGYKFLLSEPDPWEDEAWPRRIKLTFDNSVQSENLDNFPVLVVLNYSRVTYSAFQAGGADIRFFDAANASELDHEIEKWDTGGSSLIWVKVPRIDGGSSADYILMYYGNTGATGTQNPDGLWSEYKLVYHFSGSSGATVFDSTANSHDGTSSVDPPVLEAAAVGDGIRLSDTPKRYVNTGYMESIGSYTIEAWVKGDAAPELMGSGGFANGPIMGYQIYNLGWDHNSTVYQGALQLRDNVNGWKAANFGTLEGNQWYYLAGVYDGAAPFAKAYKNGALTATLMDSDGLTGTLTAPSANVFIGVESNTNNPLNGVVDEVRISDRVRSSDWIRAQHSSMSDAFITYGAEEILQ